MTTVKITKPVTNGDGRSFAYDRIYVLTDAEATNLINGGFAVSITTPPDVSTQTPADGLAPQRDQIIDETTQDMLTDQIDSGITPSQ